MTAQRTLEEARNELRAICQRRGFTPDGISGVILALGNGVDDVEQAIENLLADKEEGQRQEYERNAQEIARYEMGSDYPG